MFRTPNGGVAFADLAKNCLAPFGFAPGAGRIAVDGPEFVLREEAVVAFKLALHELATNASKYGALKLGDGRVTIGRSRGFSAWPGVAIEGGGSELERPQVDGSASRPAPATGFR